MSRILRHDFLARVSHWLMAISVVSLLATAFLPILGIRFPWVTIHWISGLVLTAAVLFHVIRASIWQDFRSMWFGSRDMKDVAEELSWQFRLIDRAPSKPGKYHAAQKLMHHGVALLVFVTVVTGLLMMVRVETPFWERDPYFLAARTWGVIFVLHGAASLALITMMIMHVYFAIRPEKRMYTRSMFLGWLTQKEYLDDHDPKRWRQEAQ